MRLGSCAALCNVLHPALLVAAAVLLFAACSERDSVTPEPEPPEETGTLELEVALQISQLGELDGAPRGLPGDPLTLTAEILRSGDVVVETRSLPIDPLATSARLAFALVPNPNYVARVRVEGARSRPTGVTEVGLLHAGSLEPIPIDAEATTFRSVSLPDLVPQFWLRNVRGERHELFWSPVSGADSYIIRRSVEGSLPALLSTTSVDTTFAVPPGFQGGVNVGYSVRAVLPDGRTSAFSESRTANDPGAVPPADIADLASFQASSSQVVLRWTAPGDDGSSGRAARYEMRFATAPIDAATFAGGTEVTLPPPAMAGQSEFAIIDGLTAEATYYFAIVTEDEAGNRSGLSNVLEVTTPPAPDLSAPAVVTDLAATTPEEGVVELTWTAPLDAREGRADVYDLRYTTGLLTDTSFPTATAWAEVAEPAVAGAAERLQVRDLPPAAYSFALRSRDSAGNLSPVSNIVTVDTRDTVRPEAVTDLTGIYQGDDRVTLAWSASGDNGRSGRAHRHDLRFATFAIDASNFGQASPIAENVDPQDPGTGQATEIAGLRAETDYWFALVTYDEAENGSLLSNVVELTTPDFAAPAAVSDMVAEEVTGTRARFFWTAPGDNGAEGTALRYDLRFSLDPITEETFDGLDAVSNMPPPSPAGTNEEVTLVASQAIAVYLALRTEDEAGQVSPLSNVVFVRFGDDAPEAASDLQAVAVGPDRVRLQWQHPGGEDYFEVERKAETDAGFARIGIVDRNGLMAPPSLGEPEVARGVASSPRSRVVTIGAARLPDRPNSLGEGTIRDGNSLGGSSRRSEGSGGDDDVIEVVDDGRTERTAYTYRVRAFSSGGPSAYSNESTARTPLAAPFGLTAEPAGVRLRWFQERDPDRFLVQRATGSGEFGFEVEVSGSKRDLLDASLGPGATYRYRVRSQAGLEDAFTDEVSVTTDEAAPECDVTPSAIEFGAVEVGSQSGSAVIITNVGGGRLQGSIVSECPDFLVETSAFDLGPGEVATREIVFRPTGSGDKLCFLSVPGDCGQVVATGIGEAAAACLVIGNDNDFGTLEPGASSTRSFRVENVGGGRFPILPLIQDDPAGVFSIVDSEDYPVVLGPGLSTEVSVRFQATFPGVHQGTLSLGTGGCAPLPLVGTAEAAGVCEWAIEDIDFGTSTSAAPPAGAGS